MSPAKNVLRNCLRPGYLAVMMRKLGVRALGLCRPSDAVKAQAWARERSENTASYAESVSRELWAEATCFADTFRKSAEARLAELGVELGGGGHYPLLYFLVRHRSPETVVETGVAAGFSSQALLAALAANGKGRLFSSDFPYFRLESPEQFVGIVVDESLKAWWELFLDGDRKNIPKILGRIESIDFVHYDSDKSREGRQFAMKALGQKLDPDALIVMDDIQDNLFFRDYVGTVRRPYKVFEFEGKFLGVVGL